MAISRSQLIQKVRNRLGEPMVKVEVCDNQVSEHIDYARQKWLKWACSNSTQEIYFTVLLQAGKTLYDLPAGIVEVVEYNEDPLKSGGINTLFTVDNFMFSQGMYGGMFTGGYDLVSYHIVKDFMATLSKYNVTPYNWKYHRSTNQLEINPAPPQNEGYIYTMGTDPDTGLSQEYVYDSPGFVMLKAFMIQGSSLPYYTPDWKDTLREIKTVVETHTISTTELTNKSMLLEHKPITGFVDKLDNNIPEDIMITLNGLGTTKNVDWSQLAVNNRVIAWEDLGFDTTLSEGDKLVVSYPVLFRSNYYPDEWTNVTATSTEIEQFTLNQSNIDNGFVNVTWPIWDNNIKINAGSDSDALEIIPNGDYIVDPLNSKKIIWKDLGLDGTLVVGDQMNITYVAVRSQRPNSTTANQSVIKQYTTKIENRTLTADEITNKSLILVDPVSAADGMKFSVGSFDRIYGVDFRLDDTQTVAWDELTLDGILVEGDDVIITYTSATYFEREVEEDLYDEDWILDFVTAMTKITLGIIRRKMANFNSLGNQGISLDGDSMVSDGQAEKELLEETLRNEESHEGWGIEIGMM
ncbi:MAG: hypothetical protein KQ78_02199 [Candidatus Izimaplasma bacterium HR2]|nr:MAG: hypothetical protein KQ78_02199 [Candidatus Izimaplasma bacterium HR2]